MKQQLIKLWNEGASLDAILASLKLAGLTKRSGAELSKKTIKLRLRGLIERGLIKKRPVVEKKSA